MSSGHCLGQSRRATLAISTAIWVAICWRKKKKYMQEREVDQGQSINTAEGGANLMGILLRGSLLKISSSNKYDTEYQTFTINTVYIVHASGDRQNQLHGLS